MKNLYRLLVSTTLTCLGITSIDAAGMSLWQQASAIDTQAVTLRFQAKVGNQPFRFYVSEVALINTNGNTVPLMLEQDRQWQY